MRRWYDEEHDMNMCEPDCVDEWLFDIWAIGCDYDGCHSAEELKKLIDELVGMAGKARDCLWDGQLFGIHGMPKPKTNGARFRVMSDEELADFIQHIRTNTLLAEALGIPVTREKDLEFVRQPVKDGDGDD